MPGSLRAIYVADTDGGPIRAIDRAEIRTDYGIVGDRAAGKSDRHVTVFRREDFLDAVREARLEETAEDGSTRRNLETQDLSAAELKGPILRVGDVVLRVTDDCRGCGIMDKSVGPGAQKALEGRAGVCCIVETGGSIRLGDPITCEQDH